MISKPETGNKLVGNRRMSLAFQKRDSVMAGAALHRATQLGANSSIANIRRNQKESTQRLKTRQELAQEQRLKAEAKLPKCQVCMKFSTFMYFHNHFFIKH